MPLLTQAGGLQRTAIYFHYPNYAFHKQNRLGSAIREGRHKLIRYYDNDSVVLYDLSQDLGERNNLASDEPEVTRKLERKLNSWLQRSGAKMPFPSNTQAR